MTHIRSSAVVIDELKYDDREDREQDGEYSKMDPAAVDIGVGRCVFCNLHGLSAFYQDILKGLLDLFTAVAQFEDRIPQSYGLKRVVIALGAQRNKSVVADRDLREDRSRT